MAAWLDTITSPLDSASKTVEKLIETRDLIKYGDMLGKVYREVLAAQRGALDAQRHEATLLDEISKLKKQIAKFETWKREKDRYRLNELQTGVLVRTLKEDMAKGEPIHHICANCYEQAEKRQLQRQDSATGAYDLICAGCETRLLVDGGRGAVRSPGPGYGGNPLTGY